MDNSTAPPSAASTPVNPSGTAYVPPTPPPVTAPISTPINQTPLPPTPPSTPLQANPPPQKKSRSWIMILSIFLLLVILGAGGYLYFMNMQKPESEMTPTDTVKTLPTLAPTATPMATDSATASVSADWKTYTNATLGIELQYPPILTASSVKGEYYTQKADKVNLRNYTSDEEYLHKDAVSITITSITPEQPVTDLKKWLEDISIGSRVDGKVGVRIGDITPYNNAVIDGLQYADGQESVWKNIAIQKDNKVFIFTLNPTSETGGSYDENKNAVEIFNQILSTVKFPK